MVAPQLLSSTVFIVCLFGYLATLAALLARSFTSSKAVLKRISHSAIGWGCHTPPSKISFGRPHNVEQITHSFSGHPYLMCL